MSVRSDMDGEQHNVRVASAPQEAAARLAPAARPATPLDLPVRPVCAPAYASCELPSIRWLKCARRGTAMWQTAEDA